MEQLEEVEEVEELEKLEKEEKLLKRFRCFIEDFYNKLKNYYNELKQDGTCEKKIITMLKNKFPYLSRTKNRLHYKLKNNLINDIHPPYIYELLNDYDERKEFNQDEKKIIYKYCCNKITPIFKHAQAEKTAICNIKLIGG